MNVPASRSEDDKDSQMRLEKNEGGKKPKSVACNEMNAEGRDEDQIMLAQQAGDECIYIRASLIAEC